MKTGDDVVYIGETISERNAINGDIFVYENSIECKCGINYSFAGFVSYVKVSAGSPLLCRGCKSKVGEMPNFPVRDELLLPLSSIDITEAIEATIPQEATA